MRPSRWIAAVAAGMALVSLLVACQSRNLASDAVVEGDWLAGHLTVAGRGAFAYRLRVPSNWAGRYRVQQEANSVRFVYCVPPGMAERLLAVTPPATPGSTLLLRPELEEPLFSITALEEAQWREQQDEPGGGEAVLWHDGVVFVRYMRLDNPYSAYWGDVSRQLAGEFQRMAGQVQGIIETFEVSPPEGSR